MKGLSRKNFVLAAKKFLTASPLTLPKRSTLIITLLIARLLLLLFEPDLNSPARGQ